MCDKILKEIGFFASSLNGCSEECGCCGTSSSSDDQVTQVEEEVSENSIARTLSYSSTLRKYLINGASDSINLYKSQLPKIITITLDASVRTGAVGDFRIVARRPKYSSGTLVNYTDTDTIPGTSTFVARTYPTDVYAESYYYTRAGVTQGATKITIDLDKIVFPDPYYAVGSTPSDTVKMFIVGPVDSSGEAPTSGYFHTYSIKILA